MEKVNFKVDEVFKNTELSKKQEILKKTILKISLDNYSKKNQKKND